MTEAARAELHRLRGFDDAGEPVDATGAARRGPLQVLLSEAAPLEPAEERARLLRIRTLEDELFRAFVKTHAAEALWPDFAERERDLQVRPPENLLALRQALEAGSDWETAGLTRQHRAAFIRFLARRRQSVATEHATRLTELLALRRQLVVGLVKMAIHQNGGVMGLSLEESIVLGVVGIVDAIDRFDPDAGTRLTTYASHWIKARQLRAVSNWTSPLREPSFRNEQRMALARARREARIDGREISEAELREVVPNLTDEVFALLMAPRCGTARLRAPGSSGAPRLLEFVLPGDPEEELVRELGQAWDLLDARLAALKQRQAEVLRARMGRDTGRGLTLREIGETQGVSRERIRQIESKGLRELARARRIRKVEKTPPADALAARLPEPPNLARRIVQHLKLGTVAEALAVTEDDLGRVPGAGAKKIKVFRAWVQELVPQEGA